MKLVGNLKKQVEETKNKEEAKDVIEEAGMLLTDDELDNVAGGKHVRRDNLDTCHNCGEPLVYGECENPDCDYCVRIYR